MYSTSKMNTCARLVEKHHQLQLLCQRLYVSQIVSSSQELDLARTFRPPKYRNLGICRFASSDSKSNHKDIFDSVKSGDAEKLTKHIIDLPSPDIRNSRGWTPMMLAAQTGQARLLQVLLSLGSNPSLKSPSGHTAADISMFWNHKDCFDLIIVAKSNTKETKDEAVFFSGSLLYRASNLRTSTEKMNELLHSDRAKFVFFHRESPIVCKRKTDSKSRKKELFRGQASDVEQLLKKLDPEKTIFLGVKKSEDGLNIDVLQMESGSCEPWFVVDLSSMTAEDIENCLPEVEVMDPYPGILQLSPDDAAVTSQALPLVTWHRTFHHCPCCGAPVNIKEMGYKRKCTNQKCRTNRGIHQSSYPRVDPSIITLISSPDKTHCLLARTKQFPPNMYSCIAGFVEPGESLEDACHREVHEETGLLLSSVNYHSSQPWPRPSVLMLGFLANASTSDIKIDENELEDAKWFSRRSVAEMITHRHSEGFFIPPRQALAHQLTYTWLKQTAFS